MSTFFLWVAINIFFCGNYILHKLDGHNVRMINQQREFMINSVSISI